MTIIPTSFSRVADRFGQAFAARLPEHVRSTIWGYASWRAAYQ